MTHELKIWPQFYCRVADGSKTFEVRENDRGFQPGDTVVLREWDPNPQNQAADKHAPIGYTGSEPLEFMIGYMLALDAKTVVFSLLPIPAPEKVQAPQAKARRR